MVTAAVYEGLDAYRCDVCGMHYRQQDQAAACERHCRDAGACSERITRQSLERAEGGA